MSTSPSWFDQEKFSRLVKKVGPKNLTEPMPSVAGTDAENPPLASTARISLVSKPPSLIAEQRALPALPRRTSPLPSIKALFPVPAAAPAKPPGAEPPSEASAPVEESKDHEEPGETASESEGESMVFENEHEALSETWHKMSLLNDELARAIHERDQALSEGQVLREQLRRTEEMGGGKSTDATSEDLERVIKERDGAIAQLQSIRAEAIKKLDAAKDLRSATQTQELTLLSEERDRARKEYSELRRQFEELKAEQGSRDDSRSLRVDSDKQLEELRQRIADRDKEISELKVKPISSAATSGGDEKLKAEVTSLREQLAKLKDEASVAQRGLALSQKALHETRDTLREATEGTSLSRHNFDNLKNECAILTQQNTVLQAQNDQLTKDLAAAKSKLTTRL